MRKSKYSLRKRLLESENQLYGVYGAGGNALSPKTTGYHSLEGKVEFAEGEAKIEMHVSYDPFSIFSDAGEDATVRETPSETTVMVPFPEPLEGRKTPTFRRGGVKVGGTDFAEIMAAMYLYIIGNQKVTIQGEGSNFDILAGQEKWEVKKFGGSVNKDTKQEYLYSVSAVRTGKTGRGIADEGLFNIAKLVRELESMYEEIDKIKSEADPGDLPPRVDELRTACYQLVHRPIGKQKPTSALIRTGTGEWGKEIFKESPPWIEDLKTVDEIIETYKCDIAGGPPYPIMSSSDWADSYLCRILDATPKVIRDLPIEDLLEFVGVSLVGSARSIAGVDEKEIFKDVLEKYFERSGITGFVFVRGYPPGDEYNRGWFDVDPLNISFLNKKQTLDAVDRGEIVLAISQKTITISYKKDPGYAEIAAELSTEIVITDKDIAKSEAPFQLPQVPPTGSRQIPIPSSVVSAALTQQQLEEQRRINALFEWALSGKRYKQ